MLKRTVLDWREGFVARRIIVSVVEVDVFCFHSGLNCCWCCWCWGGCGCCCGWGGCWLMFDYVHSLVFSDTRYWVKRVHYVEAVVFVGSRVFLPLQQTLERWTNHWRRWVRILLIWKTDSWGCLFYNICGKNVQSEVFVDGRAWFLFDICWKGVNSWGGGGT